MQLLPLYTRSRQPWDHQSFQQCGAGEPRQSLFLGVLPTQGGERFPSQIRELYSLRTKALFPLSPEKSLPAGSLTSSVLAVMLCCWEHRGTLTASWARARAPAGARVSARGPDGISRCPKSFLGWNPRVSSCAWPGFICLLFICLSKILDAKILASVLYSWRGRLCRSTSVLSTAPAKCMPLVKIKWMWIK